MADIDHLVKGDGQHLITHVPATSAFTHCIQTILHESKYMHTQCTQKCVFELLVTFAIRQCDIAQRRGNHRTPVLVLPAYQYPFAPWDSSFLVINFPFAIKKHSRQTVWFLTFLVPFFLQTTSPPTLPKLTGPRANSKFPFTLLIIGACWYFMRRCKLLNYSTLKCILTRLRDHGDGQGFHCCSEGLKYCRTKEHDLFLSAGKKNGCKVKQDTQTDKAAA